MKEIEKALNELTKKYSKETFIDLENETNLKISRWSLDSLSMNYLLGKGLPKGRIIELSGEESSGKTLIAILWAIEIQKQGGFVLFLDFEYSFDPEFYKKQGLSLSKDTFMLIQPDSIEAGFDIVETLVKTNKVNYIIWDSTNASKSKSEIEKDYGDALMGVNARSFSSGLKKVTGFLSNFNVTLVFISQIRSKIGVMYGDPRKRGVGEAIKFYASIRCDVKRLGYEDDKTDIQSINIKIKAFKNKTSVPNREIEINYNFSKGYDYNKEIVEFAITYGFIKKGGAWYTLSDGERFQGKEAIIEYIKDKEDLKKELKHKIDQVLIKQTEEEESKSEFELVNKNEEEKGDTEL